MIEEIYSKYKARGSEEEWILSYGDLMTILLCFFIIIVTVSTVDPSKYEHVADYIAKGMGAKKEKLKKVTLDQVKLNVGKIVLREKLSNDIRVEATTRGVAINIVGHAFFRSGSAELLPEAKRILSSIGGFLKQIPYFIDIEGHTDSLPIKSKTFPSNWDLSTARASRVVNHLVSLGISPPKLKAVGFADTKPLMPEHASDGSLIPKNQSKNRRVVILVTPYSR